MVLSQGARGTADYELPALFPLAIAKAGEEMGIPRERLFQGLSLERRELRNPLAKVTWDETSLLWDRLDEARPDAVARFAQYYCHRFPFVVWASTIITNPRLLYRTAFRAWRWSFLELSSRELDACTILVEARLRPGARDSAVFFEILGEILRELPRTVRRERANVEGFTSARMGTYRVRFDAVPNGDSEEELSEMLFAMLQQQARSLAPAAGIPAKWGLSPAETRTVTGLIEGHTAKQIAATCGLSIETIRTQIKSAMAKAGVKRQVDLIRQASE